jgi:hypothetical protein
VSSVRNGEANEHAVELVDNIFGKDTPVVPEIAVEHLPMLSDKKVSNSSLITFASI